MNTMSRIPGRRLGSLTLTAAATAALVFGGAAGAQAATHLPETPSTSASASTKTAPPVAISFTGHPGKETDYYVVVRRAHDLSPIFLTMSDDSGNWAEGSAGGFFQTFTFATPANPDPSGWEDFNTPDTYTATLVPFDSSQASEFADVTSVAHVSGPNAQTTKGGTSVSWTVK